MTSNNEIYWYNVAQEAIKRIVAQESVINDMSKFIAELQKELLNIKRKRNEFQ
jgi:hypothetical protein